MRMGRRRRQPRTSDGLVVRAPTVTAPLTQAGGVYRVLRSNSVVLAPGASDKGWFWNFALSDVANSNEFTVLFAQWRLARVEVDFVAALQGVAAGGVINPTITFATDPFASGTPVSLQSVLARPYKTHIFTVCQPTLTVVVPARVVNLVASGVGAGATVNNALLPPKTWLSCSQPSTTYGSLIAWISQFNSPAGAADPQITVTFRHYFEFRGQTT